MAILRNTVLQEIACRITDEEGEEVQITIPGFEERYMVPFSTREVAISDLRAAADWLESGKLSSEEPA